VLGYVQPTERRWAVAIQQNESELGAPVRQSLLIGVAMLLGAAVVVIIAARLFASMLVRPIVEVTQAADRMSMGHLDVPIAIARDDELGTLGQSLERLRRSMRAAMMRLRDPNSTDFRLRRGQ
jgi:methyl-accepting chemotaxis protein